MEHHEHPPRPSMESPERVNVGALFRDELARVPRAIALELEDHLAEQVERHLAGGKPLAEARAEALKSFGDLAVVAADLDQFQRDPWWSQLRTPWQLRVIILGWVGFGLMCLSRICVEESPSYQSIGVSLVLGLCGSLVGLGLLRRRELLRRFAILFSSGVGLLLVLKSSLVIVPVVTVPLTPGTLPLVAAAALLSAWLLNRPVIRDCFV